MLVLNKPGLINDSLVTFNYCYEPYQVRTQKEIQKTTSTIIEKLPNKSTITDILQELIQVMKNNKYNVINHYSEFKPINLVKLLYLLGLDIKQYYTEVNLWKQNLILIKNQNLKVTVCIVFQIG